LFDHDHTLILDHPRLYLLLLSRFQIAVVVSLFAHALHGIHHIALLRQESVAQICGPLNIVCHALHHIGQTCHRLNTWVPGLFSDRVGQCFVFLFRVLQKPLLKLNEFEGIG